MDKIEYKQYRRKQIAELADWTPNIDMSGVSISEADVKGGSPKLGDKIARNPKNHNDRWLVAQQYFKDNFEPVDALYTERAGETPTPISEDKSKEIAFWQEQARESTRNDINEMLKPTGLSIGMIMQGSKLVEYILCGEDGDSIPLIEFGEELHEMFVKDDSQPVPPVEPDLMLSDIVIKYLDLIKRRDDYTPELLAPDMEYEIKLKVQPLLTSNEAKIRELETNKFSLKQKEFADWQKHNFGSPEISDMIHGVAEEAGEMAHWYLKGKQGIRGATMESAKDQIADAFVDATVFGLQAMTCLGLDAEQVFAKVTTEVLKRDFVKYPKTGLPEIKDP